MSDEYYDPVLKSFRMIDNAAARERWFVETEPGELPTHQRILKTLKVKIIMARFFARLLRDVVVNARRFHALDQEALNGKNNPVQPLDVRNRIDRYYGL